MKPLPVIQVPPSPEPSASQAEAREQMETASMVNDPEKSAELMPQIVKALSTVFDPEIPVDIYELGLIYDIIVDASGSVGIRMTLTAPACPAAQILPGQVAKATETVPGVTNVKVDVVWDPPWDRDRMSDAAKLQLGMF
jgi:FeS assembly SUF system protein